jgi:hypothetical protein
VHHADEEGRHVSQDEEDGEVAGQAEAEPVRVS